MTEKFWEVKSRIDQVDRTQEWVKKQVREELIKLNKECFYEIEWEEVKYNMDTVKHYLNSLKDKKTWKELTQNNSSVLIMAVQIALYSQNYKFWRIDWLLGSKTKAAIKKFQEDNWLTVDIYWRSMPSTISKLVEKIQPMETVELSEAEKAEYMIFRPKDEKKDDNPKFKWWENGQENWLSWWQKQQEEIRVPFRPADDDKKLDDNKTDVKEKAKENEIDEEKIRPEVKELIDDYWAEPSKFSSLKDLTTAEARKIWSLAGSFLELTSLENITPEWFAELMKFNWWLEFWIKTLTPEQAKKIEGRVHSLYFNNVENIDKATADELWKTSCYLKFPSVKSLDANIWESLVKKPSWALDFPAVETIDEESAKQIAKFPWTILLDNVKSISWEVAKILWTKRDRIYLRWLDTSKPLSNEVLEWLSQFRNWLQLNNDTFRQIYDYRISKQREWKNLSQTVVDFLDHKIRDDELSKLKSITKDDAQMLVDRWRYRDLSWIESFEEETFATIMKNRGELVLWLKEIPENYLKYIEMRAWWLEFKNLTTIDEKTAESLSKTFSRLTFDSVTKIDKSVADKLSKKFRWDIIFNWVTEISWDIIKSFNEYIWTVSFNNVTKLTPEMANALVEKNTWFISLRWIKAPISEDLLPIISKAKHVQFDNSVSEQIHRYLYPERYK